jgi:ABC-type methionine transport system permease subunit
MNRKGKIKICMQEIILAQLIIALTKHFSNLIHLPLALILILEFKSKIKQEKMSNRILKAK